MTKFVECENCGHEIDCIENQWKHVWKLTKKPFLFHTRKCICGCGKPNPCPGV